MKIRCGFGYDVHRLVTDRKLFLGGIEIPHTHGLEGHSDADVLLHAVCDALLGAAALRDIGYHFPDTDNSYKNIDSKILLSKTMELVRNEGYELSNIDVTVCAEAPKINPHINAMKETMAACMQVSKDDISIKATTTEKLGFVGQKEGIAAYAVALLIKA